MDNQTHEDNPYREYSAPVSKSVVIAGILLVTLFLVSIIIGAVSLDRASKALEALKSQTNVPSPQTTSTPTQTPTPSDPVPTSTPTPTPTPDPVPLQQQIVFLHFSDFYNIEGISGFPGDTNLTVGGLSRLTTLVKQVKPDLITFGGDLFSPSSLTSFLEKPSQMVESFNFLNTLAPVIAVAGNHEFDGGINWASDAFSSCNFSWLLGNFYQPNTTNYLNGTKAYQIFTIKGIKIGIFGVGLNYKLVTSLSDKDVTYVDYLSYSQSIAQNLKQVQKVDLVIALAHLSLDEDRILLNSVPNVDLLLTGHDHVWSYEIVNGKTLVEGSIDLTYAGIITMSFLTGSRPVIRQEQVDRIKVDNNTVPVKDPEMEVIVQKYLSLFASLGVQVVGSTTVPLDTLSTSVRTKETNIGNFICDSMIEYARDILSTSVYSSRPDANSTIICLINGGSLRWNKVQGVGNITKKDVLALLPFVNFGVVRAINGSILRSNLENSVSSLPSPNGKFLQIGGFSYRHSCNNVSCASAPGSRVLNITVNGTEIQPSDKFFAVMSDFIGNGGDNYTFKVGEEIIDKESGKLVFDIILSAFEQKSPISPVVEGRIVQFPAGRKRVSRDGNRWTRDYGTAGILGQKYTRISPQ